MNETWRRRAAGIPDPAWSPVYCAIWTLLALLAGTGAAIASVTVMPPLTALEVGAGCVLVLVPSAIAWALACERPWHAWIRAALVASALTLAFGSLSMVIGPWSLLVIPGLVLTAPRLVSLVLTRLRAGNAVRMTATVPPIDRLSMQALCRLWAETSRELASTVEPARHLELALVRAACLDAMAVQDPDGCARWLAVGHLGADPEAYLL